VVLPRRWVIERSFGWMQPGKSGEVVGQVGEADLHSGARQPDGADEQCHAVLLPGEHMPDG
jgi:hypothetical protein